MQIPHLENNTGVWGYVMFRKSNIIYCLKETEAEKYKGQDVVLGS